GAGCHRGGGPVDRTGDGGVAARRRAASGRRVRGGRGARHAGRGDRRGAAPVPDRGRGRVHGPRHDPADGGGRQGGEPPVLVRLRPDGVRRVAAPHRRGRGGRRGDGHRRGGPRRGAGRVRGARLARPAREDPRGALSRGGAYRAVSGVRATSTRSRPVRSASTRTSAKCSRARSTIAGTCSGDSSHTSTPSATSHAPAPSTSSRSASVPSGPAYRASAGSQRATSSGSSAPSGT